MGLLTTAFDIARHLPYVLCRFPLESLSLQASMIYSSRMTVPCEGMIGGFGPFLPPTAQGLALLEVASFVSVEIVGN